MHPEICTAEKVCSSYFMQLAFSPRQNSRCKLSHLVIRQPGITGNGRERQTALLQQAGGNLLFGVSVAVVIALKKMHRCGPHPARKPRPRHRPRAGRARHPARAGRRWCQAH